MAVDVLANVLATSPETLMPMSVPLPLNAETIDLTAYDTSNVNWSKVDITKLLGHAPKGPVVAYMLDRTLGNAKGWAVINWGPSGTSTLVSPQYNPSTWNPSTIDPNAVLADVSSFLAGLPTYPTPSSVAIPDTAGIPATSTTTTTTTVSTATVPLLSRQAAFARNTDGSVAVIGPGVRSTLNASATRIHFIDGTIAYGVNTPEAQAARLYQAAFGRAPDASGLAYWAGALISGRSLADLAAGFLASAEFQARYGHLDDTGFVNALYRNVLNRGADATGAAYWTGKLVTGTSRATVLTSFSESNENKADTAKLLANGLWAPDPNATSVARLYYSTLGRAPDATGLTYWTSKIESGAASLQQEANLLVTSGEFIAHYGNLNNAGFVNLLYRNVLGRSADQTGLDFWSGQLAHGETRAGVVLDFSEGPELKARLAPVTDHTGVWLA